MNEVNRTGSIIPGREMNTCKDPEAKMNLKFSWNQGWSRVSKGESRIGAANGAPSGQRAISARDFGRDILLLILLCFCVTFVP